MFDSFLSSKPLCSFGLLPKEVPVQVLSSRADDFTPRPISRPTVSWGDTSGKPIWYKSWLKSTFTPIPIYNLQSVYEYASTKNGHHVETHALSGFVAK